MNALNKANASTTHDQNLALTDLKTGVGMMRLGTNIGRVVNRRYLSILIEPLNINIGPQ